MSHRSPPDPPTVAEAPSRESGWRTADLIRAALVVGAVYMVLQLLWFAHGIFFLIFLGILFGLALAWVVDRMKQWGVPRGVSAAGIVLGLIGLLVGFGTLIAPTVREQAEELRTELPQALGEFGDWVDERGTGLLQLFRERDEDGDATPGEAAADEQIGGGEGAAAGDTGEEDGADEGAADEGDGESDDAEEESPTEAIRSQLTEQVGGIGRRLFSVLSSTASVLGGMLLIVFIAIYFSVAADGYQRGTLLLIPPARRRVAQEVMRETATLLRRWLVTQMVTMLVIGILTTVVLLMLQVPAALALGLIAGLLEFIPVFGPIIAAIPAIAMGFLVSPQTALYVAIAYVVLQQLESQLLVPLLMKKGIDLPPVLTVVIQALMALVFGFLGLLVAVPLVAAGIVAVKILYIREVFGDPVSLPSDAQNPAGDDSRTP